MAKPPTSQFWPIGDFAIRLEGPVLMVRAAASFNFEAVREYGKALAQYIPRLPAAFGLYSEFDSPPVMAADVEHIMTAVTRDGVRYGLRAVAIVIPDDPGRLIATTQWSRMYESFGVPHAFFVERDAALDWLARTIVV